VSHAARIYNVNALHSCARMRESASMQAGRAGRREHIRTHTRGRITHKASSHYRPRATRYTLVKSRKQMPSRLREGDDADTVVRGFYTYGGSLMKRGQLCQHRRGLSRRRCPCAPTPSSLPFSVSVINTPMTAQDGSILPRPVHESILLEAAGRRVSFTDSILMESR